MYLVKITVKGFRKISYTEVLFQRGLNIIIGENNAGKTAIVDALRALLSTTEEGSLRLDEMDLHVGPDGVRATEIVFSYVFHGLSLDEEADFVAALKPSGIAGKYDAHFGIRYAVASSGRLRPKRWCGDHEENLISAEMLEDLRAVYLPPLRDPASGLRPSRSSQLARLLTRLASPNQQSEITELIRNFEQNLEKEKPVASIQEAIKKQHESMLGSELKQHLSVGLTAPDFQRIAARLQVEVDFFDVEQNGLGYNNLIYMAVVLSELETNPDAAYRALIIEEPEAHLHPQLQGVPLKFLQGKERQEDGHESVQIFVTSHSPNFVSIADLDTLCCVHQTSTGVRSFSPRTVKFEPENKKNKLQRYLDVTRAELFFARRIILVEGTSELFIVDALARKAGYNLKQSSVSILSADGLNFDCFLPLFGDNALQIRVAVITDSDPPADVYPSVADTPAMSAAATALQSCKSEWVQTYFAKKTLEYDLALYKPNQTVMMAALKEFHPTIGKNLEEKLNAALENEKPKTLFDGMFKREKGDDVQKGRYAQALATAIETTKGEIIIPPYIKEALDFVTKV